MCKRYNVDRYGKMRTDKERYLLYLHVYKIHCIYRQVPFLPYLSSSPIPNFLPLSVYMYVYVTDIYLSHSMSLCMFIVSHPRLMVIVNPVLYASTSTLMEIYSVIILIVMKRVL